MKQDKTIKSLKLPVAGTFNTLSYCWNKVGGHAGSKTIQKVKDKAKEAGWKINSFLINQPVPSQQHPTGSWVYNTDTLFSPDGKYKMITSSHYGDMTYQNRYSIVIQTIQE